jgi:uncharacterized Rmd1/YagE family protein
MNDIADLFPNRTKIDVHAFFLGQRLNLKKLEQFPRLTNSPYVIKAGQDGYAVLLRYGVVVLFGLNPIDQAHFLKSIADFIIDPFEKYGTEDAVLTLDPNVDHDIVPDLMDSIRLPCWNLEYLQLVADILGKSAALTYYEDSMALTFDRLEPLTINLKAGLAPTRHVRNLLKHLGYTLATQRQMIAHVEIADKPDLLWDRPKLERLYLKLEDEYEIQERYEKLNKKLDLIYRTTETMLGVQQERNSMRVEWYIVILIVIEILLHLAEKYFGF